jgi:hypothetical protein
MCLPRDVESESAAFAHGLDLHSKILESDPGVNWSVWCREKGCQGASEAGIGL